MPMKAYLSLLGATRNFEKQLELLSLPWVRSLACFENDLMMHMPSDFSDGGLNHEWIRSQWIGVALKDVFCSKGEWVALAEIENKTVEAVSLVGLGACQLQWDELINRNIQFLSAPRQVGVVPIGCTLVDHSSQGRVSLRLRIVRSHPREATCQFCFFPLLVSFRQHLLRAFCPCSSSNGWIHSKLFLHGYICFILERERGIARC